MNKQGIMLNEDSDHFLHTRMDIIEKVDRVYLKKFIEQYKNSDVTDFLMCIYGMLTTYPSVYKTAYADKYYKTEELGQTVDYKNGISRSAHILWDEKNLDMYAIWIEECRNIGINPWLSYRMNDAHCHFDVPNALTSDTFYEHLDDWARVRHRERNGYYDRCRDFEIKGVRDEFLNCLRESLQRYDPYGIELDFQREFDCFQIGHEWSSKELMTAFIGEVKSVVQNAEKNWGHKIKIAIRCHPDPASCLELGFDIIKWAELGYIDMYIASPRWYATDNDMPITLWKQILKPYHVEVAGAIEINIASSSQFDGTNWLAPVMQTVSTTLGTAANILSQGADKVYLFNYMDTPNQMCNEEENFDTDEETLMRTDIKTPFLAGKGYKKLIQTAGTLEKIHKTMRRHIVTYTDKNPLWRKGNVIFPATVSKMFPFYARIATGTVPKKTKAFLKVGIREKILPETIGVYVNSCSVIYTGQEEAVAPILTKSPLHVYKIPNEAIKSGVQIAEFITEETFTIDYIEITIVPMKK